MRHVDDLRKSNVQIQKILEKDAETYCLDVNTKWINLTCKPMFKFTLLCALGTPVLTSSKMTWARALCIPDTCISWSFLGYQTIGIVANDGYGRVVMFWMSNLNKRQVVLSLR